SHYVLVHLPTQVPSRIKAPKQAPRLPRNNVLVMFQWILPSFVSRTRLVPASSTKQIECRLGLFVRATGSGSTRSLLPCRRLRAPIAHAKVRVWIKGQC